MTFLHGRHAQYHVDELSIERVREQGTLDPLRLGIPTLHIWALPDPGDTEDVLLVALAGALDEIWEQMDTLFDQHPTPDEIELVERFCLVVQDVDLYATATDGDRLLFGEPDGYLQRAYDAARKKLKAKPDHTAGVGRVMLRWYRENVLEREGDTRLSIFDHTPGWKDGFKDPTDG